MPISSFTADPPRIKKGQSSTLKWSSEGCDDCRIMPPPQGDPQPPTGTKEVSPGASTVYLLECNCGDQPNSWTVLVEVED